MYTYVRNLSELANIGGYTLHIDDLLFIFVVIYCVAGAGRQVNRSFGSLALLALSAILLLNFVRGASEVGLKDAGVAFRNSSTFVSVSIFICFWFSRLDAQWVLNKVYQFGWLIVVLAVIRTVFGWDALMAAAAKIDPFAEPRILDSGATFMLGTAAMIALSDALWLNSRMTRWWRGISFLIFLAVVLATDQRTATFTTIGGCVVTVLLSRPHQRRLAILCGVAGIVILSFIFSAIFIASSGDVNSVLPKSINMMTEEDSTYTWRIVQWELYLNSYWDASSISQLIGFPAGEIRSIALRAPPDDIEAKMLTAVPHNGYVNFLITAGFIGLCLFLVALVGSLFKSLYLLLRVQADKRFGLAVALIIAIAIYSYAYPINESGILLAIAIGIIDTIYRELGEVSSVGRTELPVRTKRLVHRGHTHRNDGPEKRNAPVRR